MSMSRNGSDVYLSYSAGKNGQPAENGPRARKPNTSLDQEGISLERIRELRKRRGGVLSSLTSKRREIDSLLTDENNLGTVKVKLSEITSLFRRFTEAHDAYNVALVEESQRQESDLYFADIESSLDFFCRTVNDWLRVTEARLQDNLITPDDSASQIGSEVRSKSRPSMCGSRTSHFSKTSSISAARAKEAARIAELRAEAHALKHRHSLQESELRLKRQEYDLQLKKDELNLKTEYAKAVAREEAYAQAEAGNFAPSNVASWNPRCPVSVVSSITEKSRTGGSKRESFVPADKKEKLSVKSSNPVKDHKGAVSDSSSSSGNSGLSDQAYGILVQQNRVMEEFVKQQQRNLLPRRRVPVFSGDPLHYCAFIRAFETVIETRELDYAGRLYYLEQHTAGRAQELVQSCLYMKAEDGYVKAKKLLESKFGQKHKIAMAYVDKVTNGPVIKAEDADALEGFAVLLSSCTNTLKAIGYSSKFESPDSMRKIIERLPPKLQASWRDNADRILNSEARDVCIDDISLFVEQKARTLSNPVFGKLPCLEKEKKNSKDRGSRSKSERPGGKQLSLVTISETKSALNSSADVLSAVHSSKKNCLFCNADHNLTECSSFAKVPPTDRQEFVMKQRLCFSCLGGGHQSRSCHKRKPCIHCNKRHATVMHVGAPEAIVASDRGKDGPQSENNQSSTEKNRADHFCGLTTMEGSVTALPIVAVKVKVKGSPRSVETYALLDNGSNTTFCSASLMKRLSVSGKQMRIKLTTMDSCNDVDSLVVTNLEVTDLDENVVISLPEVLSRPSMPVVKDEIPKQEDVDRWPHLQGYVYLAELNSEVDLLIGANVPEALQPREVVPASDGGPYATRVDLGWVINGPTGRKQKFVPSSSFFVNCKETHPMCIACADFADATLSDGLSMSRDDLKFMNIVEDSVMQCEDGHYQVSLPLRDLNLQMPANRSQAERRALYLKRKFSKDVKFREDYVACLEKVIGDGFAEKVPLDVLKRSDGKVWFIPHHGVYHHKKPDKIRVVFDCSAHSQGTSLNDELFQGPDLTNNLVGVLIRFRQEPVAVMGDVQSMFHQVRVPEEDRDLLRFLWWPRGDFSKELEEYRMTVHLFGAVSSPSCANFAMRRNAEDHRHEFSPDVVSTVLKNFYVDDCLKSLPSATVAIKHVEELRRLMLRGGFNLTKWISNDREVLESIPVEARAKGVKDLDLDNDVLPAERALGVSWFVETDTFGFKVNIKEKPCTRRGILSVVSSVYDPLGMAAPFILPAKLLLQDLCRKSLGWDDEIPSDYLSRWRVWLNGLPKLSQMSMGRCVRRGSGKIVSSEIHHFCDASQSAFGAVSYLRQVDSDGQINCSFLLGKSRLAPLKQVTIPRLELAAATMSIRLNKVLKKELEIPIDTISFWSDSMTVLRYIGNESRRFHTYVANRVALIREDSSPSQWRHIDSKSNPADDASRGVTAESFTKNDRWIKGPAFLLKHKSEWERSPLGGVELEEDDPEVKREPKSFVVHASKDSSIVSIIQRFSSWFKLLKFIALCLRCQRRFVMRRKVSKENCLDTADASGAKLVTNAELEEAGKEIIKFEQNLTFAEELEAVKGGKCVKGSSALARLDPILTDGLLRVGGRLSRATLSDDSKHQIIIPRDSHLARLLVNHFHQKSGHSGREYVLALLRERFWLIRANSTVRSVLSSCFDCKRRQGPVGEQKMANLPRPRVTPDQPPFTCVGIDYFGPFLVRQKRSMVKRYGAIFTCLALRAVHLEVCHSLDTDSFIHALRRFIARRGQVKEIRSDNGSNFVGGERELRVMIDSWNQAKIHDALLQKSIKWVFNPPGASHHGGVWERLIRSTRKVLGALVKEQSLDDESLQTLLCECESIINGRPLTTVSDDPKDLEPLSPNHLLLLRSETPLPPGLFLKSDTYSRRRWRQVQYLADVFWGRWKREYLPLLQSRQKWFRPKKNFAVGDTVIVVDETLPRNAWAIGRITEVFPDKYGFVRRVKVKTKTSTLERPISKLCLLESIEQVEGKIH